MAVLKTERAVGIREHSDFLAVLKTERTVGIREHSDFLAADIFVI